MRLDGSRRAAGAALSLLLWGGAARAEAPAGQGAPPAPAAQGAPAGQGGPVIQMAPEEAAPDGAQAPAATPSDLPVAPPPPRGVDPGVLSQQSYSTDLGSGRRIPIGAYGETHLVFNQSDTTFNLRRLVLFFGHRFADWVAVYSEMEVENVSRFEIEQSYLEITPFKKTPIGLRAGLVLIPLGIVNLYHEPPTFNGVDRPLVDQLIIPSTWRELGAGVFGTIPGGLHYQVYAVAGSDGSRFTAAGGIGPGLSRGFDISTHNAAVTGRINWNRVLGLDLAAGFYYGGANNKDKGLDGVRVGLIEADARFSRFGLSLRAEYARLFISGAERITELLRASAPTAAAVGAQGQGFYAEAAYNVLYPVQSTDHMLTPFLRYELVDTRAVLPDVPNPGETEALHFLTAGVTYRPKLELAFKFDYRRTLAGNDGSGGNDRYSLGIAFMY